MRDLRISIRLNEPQPDPPLSKDELWFLVDAIVSDETARARRLDGHTEVAEVKKRLQDASAALGTLCRLLDSPIGNNDRWPQKGSPFGAAPPRAAVPNLRLLSKLMDTAIGGMPRNERKLPTLRGSRRVQKRRPYRHRMRGELTRPLLYLDDFAAEVRKYDVVVTKAIEHLGQEPTRPKGGRNAKHYQRRAVRKLVNAFLQTGGHIWADSFRKQITSEFSDFRSEAAARIVAAGLFPSRADFLKAIRELLQKRGQLIP
jgi:hypothetical protein